MLCQLCNKNQATIHITQMVKGKQKQELHLCEGCAKSQGMTLKPSITFSELLSGFMEPHVGDPEQLKIPCPRCGGTYSDFREIGRLGCPGDYEAFKKNLIHLMDRIHRATQHVGKIPSRAGHVVTRDARLADLEVQLRDAVRVENYELAAEIRDKIAALKEKLEQK